LGTTSWSWSATGVVAVAAAGVVVGGALRWAVRGDGDGCGDVDGQARARGHRDAWPGCGHCSCCHPVPTADRTYPRCQNTVYHLSREQAQPLDAVNSETLI